MKKPLCVCVGERSVDFFLLTVHLSCCTLYAYMCVIVSPPSLTRFLSLLLDPAGRLLVPRSEPVQDHRVCSAIRDENSCFCVNTVLGVDVDVLCCGGRFLILGSL